MSHINTPFKLNSDNCSTVDEEEQIQYSTGTLPVVDNDDDNDDNDDDDDNCGNLSNVIIIDNNMIKELPSPSSYSTTISTTPLMPFIISTPSCYYSPSKAKNQKQYRKNYYYYQLSQQKELNYSHSLHNQYHHQRHHQVPQQPPTKPKFQEKTLLDTPLLIDQPESIDRTTILSNIKNSINRNIHSNKSNMKQYYTTPFHYHHYNHYRGNNHSKYQSSLLQLIPPPPSFRTKNFFQNLINESECESIILETKSILPNNNIKQRTSAFENYDHIDDDNEDCYNDHDQKHQNNCGDVDSRINSSKQINDNQITVEAVINYVDPDLKVESSGTFNYHPSSSTIKIINTNNNVWYFSFIFNE